MNRTAQTVTELEKILARYTTFFIVFDIVFFVILFSCLILAIRFLKSKKKLENSNEYIKYAIYGQEEERERIARELHDTVAQNLRYCKSLCEKENIQQNLSKLENALSKSLTEVRAMSYNLSPPDITKNNFLICIQNLSEEIYRISNLPIRLSILDGTDTSFLNKNEILNLYRIIQEALTNITKHANAEEAVILLRNQKYNENKGIYIFISDDGIGFDIDKIDLRKHYGLEGMKKRAELINANISISSNKEEGTQISIFKAQQG